MLVCLIFCKPLLRLVFGAVEEDVMNGAVRYFLITVIAYPFLALFEKENYNVLCGGAKWTI